MTNLVEYCEVCDSFVEEVYPIPASCYTERIGSGFGFFEKACLICFDKYYDVLLPVFRKCNWCGEIANRNEFIQHYGQKFYHEDCFRKKRLWQNEKLRVESHNKRTSNLSLISDLTLDEWMEILDKYNFRCAYCNGRYEELEHVVPVSLGGGTTKKNVVPSCKKCNRKKKGQIWKPNLERAVFL